MTPVDPPTDPAKVLLRLPRGLHEQLRATADAQGVSVNSLLIALLAGSVGWSLEHQMK
jgi:predicted HicB family RNase H-like nuclease